MLWLWLLWLWLLWLLRLLLELGQGLPRELLHGTRSPRISARTSCDGCGRCLCCLLLSAAP